MALVPLRVLWTRRTVGSRPWGSAGLDQDREVPEREIASEPSPERGSDPCDMVRTSQGPVRSSRAKKEKCVNGSMLVWGLFILAQLVHRLSLAICSAETTLESVKKSKSLVRWLRFEDPKIRASLVLRE